MWCEAGKNLGAGEKRRAGSPVARRASLSLGFWLYLSLLYKPESQRRSRLGAHGPSGGLTGSWTQERGSDTSHLHPQHRSLHSAISPAGAGLLLRPVLPTSHGLEAISSSPVSALPVSASPSKAFLGLPSALRTGLNL